MQLNSKDIFILLHFLRNWRLQTDLMKKNEKNTKKKKQFK